MILNLTKYEIVTFLWWSMGWSSLLIGFNYWQLQEEFTTMHMVYPVIGGSIGGIIFVIGQRYHKKKLLKSIPNVAIEPDEEIIKEGAAHFFRHRGVFSGKLVLTTQSLYIASKLFKTETNALKFPLAQICQVEVKKISLAPTQIRIYLDAAGVERIVLNHEKEWEDLLMVRNTQ